MRKFNGFEVFIIKDSLKLYAAKMRKELTAAEKKGQRPFMTAGYIDMVIKDLVSELPNHTAKDKFANRK